ncbi:MAG: RluA family pseudouridine synthase [Deltaproteobacteria bacterium]|nr:RluA family pseudouridine synthase [Deltaproteobacteria bacterium]
MWTWIVEPDDAGVRLDHYLRDRDTGITRSQVRKLIDAGLATVDGAATRPATKLRPEQRITLRVPPPEPLSAEPEEIPLDVRYEDEALLVVNKPQGMVVHPAPGHPRGTLVNAVLFGRQAAGGDPLRPGIVHRLDKDTSGLLVVAKQEQAHHSLALQFHEHTVDRRYRVLVTGSPPDSGEWRTLHARHPRDRRRFSSRVRRGREAISRFRVRERFPGGAEIEVTLHTGRTHQVRVHCHDHGFPVLGDPWYGPRKPPPGLREIHIRLPGQALHAELLGFEHPMTRERMRFSSEPPDAWTEALDAARRLVRS